MSALCLAVQAAVLCLLAWLSAAAPPCPAARQLLSSCRQLQLVYRLDARQQLVAGGVARSRSAVSGAGAAGPLWTTLRLTVATDGFKPDSFPTFVVKRVGKKNWVIRDVATVVLAHRLPCSTKTLTQHCTFISDAGVACSVTTSDAAVVLVRRGRPAPCRHPRYEWVGRPPPSAQLIPLRYRRLTPETGPNLEPSSPAEAPVGSLRQRRGAEETERQASLDAPSSTPASDPGAVVFRDSAGIITRRGPRSLDYSKSQFYLTKLFERKNPYCGPEEVEFKEAQKMIKGKAGDIVVFNDAFKLRRFKEYNVTLVCGIRIAYKKMVFSPSFCPSDIEACRFTPAQNFSMKEVEQNTQYERFVVSLGINDKFAPFCTCRITIPDGKYSKEIGVMKYSGYKLGYKPREKGFFSRLSDLVRPPAESQIKPLRVREMLAYPTTPLRVERIECAEPHAALHSFLRQRHDSAAFAVRLLANTKLCPAMGGKLMAVHLEPPTGCDRCPPLGYVYLIFPFPWDSLLVRELAMEEVARGLRPAAFHVYLPLHVTQHVVPGKEYRASQVALEVGPSNEDEVPGVTTASSSLTMEHPRLQDSCVIQLEFSFHLIQGRVGVHCPPAIETDPARTQFQKNVVDFSVKGVQFSFRAFFDVPGSLEIKRWTLDYDGRSIKSIHPGAETENRTLVSLIKPDLFTYVPYRVTTGEAKGGNLSLLLYQSDRLLFSVNSTIPRDAVLKSIQFGLPNLCSTSLPSQTEATSAGMSIKIRVFPAKCQPGVCSPFQIEGNTRNEKPLPDTPKLRPNWMMNVRPHWNWRQAFTLYKKSLKLELVEKRGLTSGPAALTLIVVGNSLEMLMNHLSVFVPQGIDPGLTLAQILEKRSRWLATDLSGEKTPPPQVASAYVSYDQMTLEFGLADLRTPLARIYNKSQEMYRNEPRDEVHSAILDTWNGPGVDMYFVASVLTPGLLRYVVGFPCQLEDQVPEPPACVFYKRTLNPESVKQCVERLRCNKRKAYDRGSARPTWHSCLYDANCPMKEYLDESAKLDSLMSGKVDFAIEVPTMVIVPFSDLLGKLENQNVVQYLMLRFLKTKIVVRKVWNAYSDEKVLISIPMPPDYLRNGSNHGFRLKTRYSSGSSANTAVLLQDLHELRPDHTGDATIWADRFGYRMLLTRISFQSLVGDTADGQLQQGSVLVDCVPSYDKCSGENPCQNGGTCFQNACKCKPGYEAEDCSRNACHKSECGNGGTCVPTDVEPYWACQCDTSRWQGDRCETMFDYCFSSPCQNRGTCSPEVGTFRCACTDEYDGDKCQNKLHVCDRRNPCKNGGTCQSVQAVALDDDQYECQCAERFAGKNCTVSLAWHITLLHMKEGLALTTYPFELVMMSYGSIPFECHVSLGANQFFKLLGEDFDRVPATFLRKLLEDNEFEMSQYKFSGSVLHNRFGTVYARPGTYQVEVKCFNKGIPTPVDPLRPVKITPNDDPSLCMPTVTIRNTGLTNESAPRYHRRDTLRIYAITKSDCASAKIKLVLWSLHRITEADPYPTYGNKYDIPGVVMDHHELRIPAFKLPYGLWTVKMRADAYLKKLGTISAFELGWFRIDPLPLECLLNGGDKLSMPQNHVVIDGRHSRDGDNANGYLQGVTIEWRCWRSPSGQSTAFCHGPHRELDYDYLTLHVPAEEVRVRDKYDFEMRIIHSGSGRNCTAIQTVEVTPPRSVRATILCRYNCRSPADWQDKISYRADCLNCNGTFNVRWSISTEGAGAGVVLSWREDTSFGPNNKNLIINAGVLDPKKTYQIGVKVAAKGQDVEDGSAQVTTLRLNQVPSGGRCEVEPSDGVSAVTVFTLRCSNWTDDQTPLTYQFQQTRPDGGFSVLYEDINPEASNITLTVGDPKRNFVSTVRVRITDATGVSTHTTINVTVRPPVTIEEAGVIDYTKSVFKLLPSGLDQIVEAISQGNFPHALQVVSASSSLLSQVTDPNAERISEEDTKRKLRQKLLDSLDSVPTSTLGNLEQTADALTAIASGHRDEYYPETTEKLINKTEKLAETLLNEFAKDDSVPAKTIEKACKNVLTALTGAVRVATEDVKPPSLRPVDLYYPNNERDYEVFDEERIEHIEEKRARVAKVAHKLKKTTDSVYQALGKNLEPGEAPKMLDSGEMTMWVQHFDRKTAPKIAYAGLPHGKEALETESNYAVMPNIGDILDKNPGVKGVELTVTGMKRNPYWWDEESAKNVSTDIVSINLRSIPDYKNIKVGRLRKKMDIFLRRGKSDVEHVQSKAILLDWYHTLYGRKNHAGDEDVVDHKIILPPGGFSQVVQLIPIPQVVVVTDRRDQNITYEVPVKLFVNFLPGKKAGIDMMRSSFEDPAIRKKWTLPKTRYKAIKREVDVFSFINPAPKDTSEIKDWYLCVLIHPETAKRLLNDTVLQPNKSRASIQSARSTGVLEYQHDPDEILYYKYAMGQHVMKAREMHSRFVEVEDMVPMESMGDITVRKGWLMPRSSSSGAGSGTGIKAIYRDELLHTLDRQTLCTPSMTYEECERKHSVKYNLTLFAGRCMYWSDEITAFTDQGCEVGPLSTVEVLHCRCSHLTDFAGSFLVLPNKVDITLLVNLNMILAKNPTAVYLMGLLLLAYLLLLGYARKQDSRDVKRRYIVYVDDNDPRHQYAYLVTVCTGVMYKAGTTAHVAMVLHGDRGSSETHLLTGEKKRKRTLERGSDSWFLITTAASLGNITELHIWHDNSGKNPEWYLERVLVRDCQTDQVWVFIIDRWVHPVTGLLVEAKPAALHEVIAWNNSIARRAEESLRDGHLWFSVFSRPLNSPFTRCQRLACAMTLLMANMLASLMFYGVPTGGASDQISRSQSFGLDWYDVAVSAQSAVLVSVLVLPVIVLFRRSRPREDVQRRTVVRDEELEQPRTAASGDKEAAKDAGGGKSADLEEMQTRVEGGALALPERRERCLLPSWCVYVAWALSSTITAVCTLLCLAYSAQFGSTKCYIWLASSGVSLLQTVLLIQPLAIVGASWLVGWCCKPPPEVENRSAERPQLEIDADLTDEYVKAIHARRTLPMYRQVPRRKLRKMRAKKMKNLLTHEAIRDILTFVIYIWCLLLIVHGNKDPNAYYSSQTVANMFVEKGTVPGDDEAVKFGDVVDLPGVIKYLNTTFIYMLHWEENYNGEVKPHDGMTRQDGLFFIGVVRLRQVRVARNACRTADELFWMNFTACKLPFRWRDQEEGDFGQKWSPEPHFHADPWTNEATEAWLHKDATYLQTLPFHGRHALYPGSGYTLHLGRRTTASQVVLNYMEETRWLDEYTRALFVEFTLYSADSDLFNLVVLLFEQTGVGTVSTSYQIRTSKLYVDAHINRLTIFMLGFYVFFVVCNTAVESRKLFRLGPKHYFADKWQTLDLVLVLMGYVCVVLYIHRHLVLEKAFERLRDTDENKFANFYVPVFWDYVLTYTLSFTLVLTLAKFWKILTFNKRMVTFSLTLQYSQKELKAFFLIFFIAVIGYAFWANGIFGSTLDDYRNMWSSIISLILFSIGSFDYPSYVSTDRTFGLIFFVSYVFFIMIYLINVMLSIIMAGYEMAMDDMEHLVTKYDVVDVFIWEVRNFFQESSSSSSEEEAAARSQRRRRRRARQALRALFPWCIQDQRERDLRRPVEQEQMYQLQRFMSRTQAAGGVPPAPIGEQGEGSIGSEEEAAIREAVGRRRRSGMIEPEESDEEEGAGDAAAPRPGHRFLLDHADVSHKGRGRSGPEPGRRAERRQRLHGRRHHKHAPPQAPPRRASMQTGSRLPGSLAGVPGGRKMSASPRRSSSARRRSRLPPGGSATGGQTGASGSRLPGARSGAGASGSRLPGGRSGTGASGSRLPGGRSGPGGGRPDGGGSRQRPRGPDQPSTSGLTRADLTQIAARASGAASERSGPPRQKR